MRLPPGQPPPRSTSRPRQRSESRAATRSRTVGPALDDRLRPARGAVAACQTSERMGAGVDGAAWQRWRVTASPPSAGVRARPAGRARRPPPVRRSTSPRPTAGQDPWECRPCGSGRPAGVHDRDRAICQPTARRSGASTQRRRQAVNGSRGLVSGWSGVERRSERRGPDRSRRAEGVIAALSDAGMSALAPRVEAGVRQTRVATTTSGPQGAVVSRAAHRYGRVGEVLDAARLGIGRRTRDADDG